MVATLQKRIKDGSCPEPNSGCWLWEGSVTSDGYGRIGVGRGISRNAHRVSYSAFVCPIPDGMHVLHHCDTPCCVNPSHLFLGSHIDNIRDMDRKGRRANTAGERNGRARLTQNDVDWITVFANQLGWSYRLIAECHGVSKSTVAHILRGLIWNQ
jgi:hypothetical protein